MLLMKIRKILHHLIHKYKRMLAQTVAGPGAGVGLVVTVSLMRVLGVELGVGLEDAAVAGDVDEAEEGGGIGVEVEVVLLGPEVGVVMSEVGILVRVGGGVGV